MNHEKRVRRLPSPSLPVAIAAVVVASTGTAVAATAITSQDIKNGTFIAGVSMPAPGLPGAPTGGAKVEDLIGSSTLRVVTFDTTTGAAAELPFHVAAFC